MSAQGVRRRALSVVVTLVASCAIPLLAASPASAAFTQCPALGLDTSCGALITISPGSPPTAAIAFDTSQGPYDGADDTLVGVQNNVGGDTIALHIDCSGCPNPIFGFDGDGLCTATGAPAACPFGPTGYEGPDVTFTNYCAPSCNSGTVLIDFGATAACGTPTKTTAYFSLEDSLTAASVLTVTVLTPHAEALSNTPNTVSHAGPLGPISSQTVTAAHQVVGPVTLDAMRAHAEAPTYTQSEADAFTGKVTAVVGANTITASAVSAKAQAKCIGTHRFFSGEAQIADLSLNGVSQGNVTPGPNTTVALPQCGAGGGITLNEQRPIFGGDGLQVTAIAIYCPLLGIDVGISVARVWFG